MLNIFLKRSANEQVGNFEQKITRLANTPNYTRDAASEPKQPKKRNEEEWRELMEQRNYFLRAL